MAEEEREWLADSYPHFRLGSDPEIFITNHGKVVPSEALFPAEPIAVVDTYSGSTSKVARDGVQLEIQPYHYHCRSYMNTNIAACMKKVGSVLAEANKANPKAKWDVSLETLIELTEDEWKDLPDSAKILGCNPSFNSYPNTKSIEEMGVTTNSLIRSLGGHIHISASSTYFQHHDHILKSQPEMVVKVLDIIVGNTCVLLDRHPGNKKRRQYYGRAGEYRTPKFGLEYRTLSGFWLKANWLSSLVFSLVRHALCIACRLVKAKVDHPGYGEGVKIWKTVESKRDFAAELFALVDMKDIQKAINDNDFDLAMTNFDKWIGWYMENRETTQGFETLVGRNEHTHYLDVLMHMARNGYKDWLNPNPLAHWASVQYMSPGWEKFAEGKWHELNNWPPVTKAA